MAAGWVVGLRPLGDNSFLTHLATGRLILDRGSVPSVDPYTFTASGEPWVVQSWLASTLYASVEALTGAVGLRLLMGVVAALLTALAWRLTRPAKSVLVRLSLGVVFVAANAGLWAERPFMIGLLALACVVLAADGDLDPRWLVPVAWVWVNVHGSFPLGLAYLVVVAVGRRLDGTSPVHELRALRWAALGVLLGAVGPLGPHVLVFPLELLQRQDVLRNVIEWQAPTFDTFSQRMFLVQLVLAIVLLVRRPTYRGALVMAVFAAAALLSVRNVTVASLLMLPGMAAAAPTFGALRATTRGRVGALLAATGLVAAVLLGAARLGQGHFSLEVYPVDAVAFLAREQIDLTAHRMAAQDVVGNYLELIYGPRGIVFYDDRFDMFPDAISKANLALVRSAPSVRAELAALDIELLLWDRASAAGQRAIADPDWRVLYSDSNWIVACRRGTELGSPTATC